MLKIELITDKGDNWNVSGESIMLPGFCGAFQILTGHIAFLSILIPGKIIIKNVSKSAPSLIKSNEKDIVFNIQDGLVENHNDKVVVIGCLNPV
jgi:F0F1-type ATP synthase epsilon subunit